MFEDAEATVDVFGVPLPPDGPRPRYTSATAGAPTQRPSLAQRQAERATAQPVTSPPVTALVAAVDTVLAQVPADLPGPQALTDTAVLLAQVERMRAGLLTRLADVERRKLHVIDGAPSTSSWIDTQQTSLDRGEMALARRLGSLPRLQEAVSDGRLSIAAAGRVGKALARLRPHLDRPDGLIDGQDAEQALLGVIGHGVRQMVCQALAGLAEDDPRLLDLLEDLAAIVGSRVSQYARLESASVLLADQVEPVLLPGALAQLVDALLPQELEKRAADAHANRGFGLRLNADGSGWHVTDGDLDLECGELLQALLQAELAVDPDRPTDTAELEEVSARGWQAGDELPDAAAGCVGPRSLRQQRHDALKRVLRRYLDSGLVGLRDKVAPHLSVIVSVDLLQQHPGALPAVSATSGARLPASLVRAWLPDSAVSRFVLSLGGRVIEASHTERTLKAHERRAKRIETGGRCQGAGCRCGPGRTLVPHHGEPWARSRTTSLRDTVLACSKTHHDIHSGHHRIRLRDGRWLDQDGWADGPGPW